MALYLREPAGITLRELADELDVRDSRWGGVTTEMDVRLDNNNERMSFVFGNEEIPATADGMEQVASFIGMPRNFLLGLDPDMQQYNLSNLLRRNAANVTVRYDETGIHEVHKPDRTRLEPIQIAQTAIRVMGEESTIVDWTADSDELSFDVMVPENFDRGIGGDREIGDISRGGLRFFQDRKHNHSPTVNSYIYRLVCTNGMVVPDTGLTLDARGSTVEVLLAELEMAAQRAFTQVEEQMEHFYAMREQRIEGDVTQAVFRVAQERGLPNRTVTELVSRVPSELNADTLGHDPSMFDIVNLITNQANRPGSRRGPRRVLEMAGGQLVQQHQDRCGRCAQVISH